MKLTQGREQSQSEKLEILNTKPNTYLTHEMLCETFVKCLYGISKVELVFCDYNCKYPDTTAYSSHLRKRPTY